MLLRAVRAVLMGVGLWTIVRTARDPKLRRETVEAVAQRFPVEELLEEIALELAAARAAVTGDSQSSEAASHRAGDQEEDDAAQRRRRPAPRRRGDRNGQRGRKPPNRGTRA